MITPSDINDKRFSTVKNGGYDASEVNEFLQASAESYVAVVEENKQLFRKMEILAKKIEEYRDEEDSIKSALITAQKTANAITKQAKDGAESVLTESTEKAQKIVQDAKEKANGIVKEADEYAKSVKEENLEEAEAIISAAEIKANEAINASKIVSKNIIEEAKSLADNLVKKAREKKESYENILNDIKAESLEIKESLVSLYESQLEKIKSVNCESDDDYSVDESEYISILEKVNRFEKEEIEIEQPVEDTEDEETVEYETESAEDISEETETEAEDISEETEETEDSEEKPDIKQTNYFANEDNDFSFASENDGINSVGIDVETAVNDFSTDEITPVRNTRTSTIEILDDDEDDDDILQKETPSIEDFGSIFGTNEVTDRTTEKISLIPPEDDEDDEDDEPKFKGFFKKKR